MNRNGQDLLLLAFIKSRNETHTPNRIRKNHFLSQPKAQKMGCPHSPTLIKWSGPWRSSKSSNSSTHRGERREGSPPPFLSAHYRATQQEERSDLHFSPFFPFVTLAQCKAMGQKERGAPKASLYFEKGTKIFLQRQAHGHVYECILWSRSYGNNLRKTKMLQK